MEGGKGTAGKGVVEAGDCKRPCSQFKKGVPSRVVQAVRDRSGQGGAWADLAEDVRIAQMVYESLLHRNDREYNLYSFSIMSNHVHVVFRPLLNEQSLIEMRESARRRFSTQPTLSAIMQSLKGYTARQANKILGRTGAFGDAESYDHQIADQAEFGRIERYVLNNPVKAGLVSDWKDFRWNWRRPM
jgi:putative transposase